MVDLKNNEHVQLTNSLHGLWNPEVHKGSPIIPILSRINPISRIDTCLFKVQDRKSVV